MEKMRRGLLNRGNSLLERSRVYERDSSFSRVFQTNMANYHLRYDATIKMPLSRVFFVFQTGDGISRESELDLVISCLNQIIAIFVHRTLELSDCRIEYNSVLK